MHKIENEVENHEDDDQEITADELYKASLKFQYFRINNNKASEINNELALINDKLKKIAFVVENLKELWQDNATISKLTIQYIELYKKGLKMSQTYLEECVRQGPPLSLFTPNLPNWEKEQGSGLGNKQDHSQMGRLSHLTFQPIQTPITRPTRTRPLTNNTLPTSPRLMTEDVNKQQIDCIHTRIEGQVEANVEACEELMNLTPGNTESNKVVTISHDYMQKQIPTPVSPLITEKTSNLLKIVAEKQQNDIYEGIIPIIQNEVEERNKPVEVIQITVPITLILQFSLVLFIYFICKVKWANEIIEVSNQFVFTKVGEIFMISYLILAYLVIEPWKKYKNTDNKFDDHQGIDHEKTNNQVWWLVIPKCVIHDVVGYCNQIYSPTRMLTTTFSAKKLFYSKGRNR